jgi:uncharacterized protein YjbI with pentapeptide repeats
MKWIRFFVRAFVVLALIATQTPSVIYALSSDCTVRTPAADLSGCNLTGANLSGLDLSTADFTGATLTSANLAGTNLSAALLTGVRSGGTSGVPSALPVNWILVNQYLVGPLANLTNADLSGTTITTATLLASF